MQNHATPHQLRAIRAYFTKHNITPQTPRAEQEQAVCDAIRAEIEFLQFCARPDVSRELARATFERDFSGDESLLNEVLERRFGIQ